MSVLMAVKKNGSVEGSLPDELMKLLLSLASKWGDDLDLGTINVKHLSGAMTNAVYQISWPTKMEKLTRKVLVRVYGEGVELFFDRDDEIRTFEFLSRNGHGPKLLGQFPAGRIEEFIQARVLSTLKLSFLVKFNAFIKLHHVVCLLVPKLFNLA